MDGEEGRASRGQDVHAQGHAEGGRVWWARSSAARAATWPKLWRGVALVQVLRVAHKKRVVLPADAGRAEQANDERAGLVQDARGKMETDADVVRLQAEQMIGAAGAPSHVTAERRLKDNGLTAVRRPLHCSITSLVTRLVMSELLVTITSFVMPV